MDYEHNKFMEIDTNEKPLWRIAQEAYLATTPFACRDWKAVADAVITEHERRKAEPVKPDPNAECKAAFAAGKRIQYDHNSTKPGWCVGWTTCQSTPNWSDDEEYRVHPDDVETDPDPFAAEKAAFEQGETIQYYSQSRSEWLDCDPHPPGWYPGLLYRVKPEPVMVELGPDDVPPGTILRGAGEVGTKGWCMIVSCSETGIRLWHASDQNQNERTWRSLFGGGSQINRNDGLGWVPCSKIKPE